MPKILIIDDSAVMRKIILRNIQKSGLLVDEFVEAGDGKEGLEKATANNVDLILYDWDMPNLMEWGISGVDFVKAVRDLGQKRNIPVIVVTTKGDKAKIEEVKKSGANSYLTKPFTLDQLRLKLDKFLKVK